MKAVIDKEDDQSKLLSKSNFVVDSFWDSHLEESNSFSLAMDPSFSSKPSSLWNHTFTFAWSFCPYSEEEMDWCYIFTFQSGLARSVLYPNPTWKRSHWTRPLQGWDGLGNDLNICSRGFDLACGINEIKNKIMTMTMMRHLTRVKWCLSREASSRQLFGGHTVDNAIARGPTFLVPQNTICVTYNSEQ